MRVEYAQHRASRLHCAVHFLSSGPPCTLSSPNSPFLPSCRLCRLASDRMVVVHSQVSLRLVPKGASKLCSRVLSDVSSGHLAVDATKNSGRPPLQSRQAVNTL